MGKIRLGKKMYWIDTEILPHPLPPPAIRVDRPGATIPNAKHMTHNTRESRGGSLPTWSGVLEVGF